MLLSSRPNMGDGFQPLAIEEGAGPKENHVRQGAVSIEDACVAGTTKDFFKLDIVRNADVSDGRAFADKDGIMDHCVLCKGTTASGLTVQAMTRIDMNMGIPRQRVFDQSAFASPDRRHRYSFTSLFVGRKKPGPATQFTTKTCVVTGLRIHATNWQTADFGNKAVEADVTGGTAPLKWLRDLTERIEISRTEKHG